ncbi:MAG: rhodanese-like domain-containing protein [Lachnospiraceae bacterium]
MKLLLIISLVLLSGCRNTTDSTIDSNYITIDSMKAKEMIDNNTNAIVLDVRSQAEYDEKHLPNALLLPDTEVLEKAEEVLPDKDALILVYCRSGTRSKKAAAALVSLGYTTVYEFGGIQDWPYDTVSS